MIYMGEERQKRIIRIIIHNNSLPIPMTNNVSSELRRS